MLVLRRIAIDVMVRQADYTIGKARHRYNKRATLLKFSIKEDLPVEVQLKAWKQLKAARADVLNISARAHKITNFYFNLNYYSDEQALHYFRFRKQDIQRVCHAMGWTSGRTKRNGYICEPITACCVVLKRLASTVTWFELETTFGMRSSALSEVFWEVLERFVELKKHLITTLRESFIQQRAATYAEAIKNAGAPLDSCVGFIDCTKIKIARPGGPNRNQRACYSGHKRFHCLVYQTITTPDGLIFSFYGPEEGRRHDMTLLHNSGISGRLAECLLINGRKFYVYGDAAYVLRPWMQTAFSSAAPTDEEGEYNTDMSAARVTVEWNYKDLKQLWNRNDYSRSLKVRQCPVSLLYVGGALLLNFKTCIENWGQVSKYFRCKAPSFEEYKQA